MSDTTTKISPFTGTNFYIQALLVLASLAGGMSQDEAGLIVSGLSGAVAAVFAFRNWVVGRKFVTPKTWWGDANNWSYLTAALVAILPFSAELLPPIKDLITAFIAKDWGNIIKGLISLGTIIYYLLKKPAA